MPKNPSDLLTRAVSNVTPRDLAEKKLVGTQPLRLYFGIDPTSPRLHLGHAVPLRKMRAFQDAGHEVILVIGSFTAMIGDPSGRDAMREPLTKEQVKKNFESYMDQAKLILDEKKLTVRYNHEWLEKLGFHDIMDLAGKFTIQRMLERDMFKKRIEAGNPIGMHEFLYPLMVGYDSVTLDVDCEIGGNDQYFNMLAGRTLQTAFKKRDKFVLTTKLIEGTDGRKMSKTYNNCIYLTDSADAMFGKIMSIKDDLIPTYLECCTDMPMDGVRGVEQQLKGGSVNPRDLKLQLAEAIVTLYHGAAEAKKAHENFTRVFSEKGVPKDMPEITVKKGSTFLDVIAGNKLVASKSDVRRLAKQGAIKLDDVKIDDATKPAAAGVLKVGKRTFVQLKIG